MADEAHFENDDLPSESELQWRPDLTDYKNNVEFVQRCVEDGKSPLELIQQFGGQEAIAKLPKDLEIEEATLWHLVLELLAKPRIRDKREDITTLDDLVQLIQRCNKILVITGAGVSVSCGIPDFRSSNGIYAQLLAAFPELPDPHAMFDIDYFDYNPKPFFTFAKAIYPGQFKPSLCHRFIRKLEKEGKLLRDYTQNIDSLEVFAGIHNLIQCHGSFEKATCRVCGHQTDGKDIEDLIFKQSVPHCPLCPTGNGRAVLKPDIVFFGEDLSDDFNRYVALDKNTCDLVIVIGASMKVRTVSLIPHAIPSHVPQVLINKQRVEGLNFDVELLGDCDHIVGELCRRLGAPWTDLLPPSSSSHATISNELNRSEWLRSREMRTTSDEPSGDPHQIDLPTRPVGGSTSTTASPGDKLSMDSKIMQATADIPRPEERQRFSAVHLKGDEYVCLADRCYLFHGAEIEIGDIIVAGRRNDHHRPAHQTHSTTLKRNEGT